MSNHKIVPCIWYDDNVTEAFNLYSSVFSNTSAKVVNGFLSEIDVDGTTIWGINGGPMYKPNPAFSFYTICETEEEINDAYNKFMEEGKALMPLDKYDWSPAYAWVEDSYGVSWQLTLGNIQDTGQKVTPSLMYIGDNYGKAEEAMNHLMQLFPNSKEDFIHRYEDDLQKGKIAHAQFYLGNTKCIVLESAHGHDFNFNEGNSLVILCEDQQEIDHYWDGLTKDGEEGRCGWCKDKYGFSWQVIPRALDKIMNDPDKGQKAIKAFQPMNKIDYNKILEAIK